MLVSVLIICSISNIISLVLFVLFFSPKFYMGLLITDIYMIIDLARAVEYANCISAEW